MHHISLKSRKYKQYESKYRKLLLALLCFLADLEKGKWINAFPLSFMFLFVWALHIYVYLGYADWENILGRRNFTVVGDRVAVCFEIVV